MRAEGVESCIWNRGSGKASVTTWSRGGNDACGCGNKKVITEGTASTKTRRQNQFQHVQTDAEDNVLKEEGQEKHYQKMWVEYFWSKRRKVVSIIAETQIQLLLWQRRDPLRKVLSRGLTGSDLHSTRSCCWYWTVQSRVQSRVISWAAIAKIGR